MLNKHLNKSWLNVVYDIQAALPFHEWINATGSINCFWWYGNMFFRFVLSLKVYKWNNANIILCLQLSLAAPEFVSVCPCISPALRLVGISVNLFGQPRQLMIRKKWCNYFFLPPYIIIDDLSHAWRIYIYLFRIRIGQTAICQELKCLIRWKIHGRINNACHQIVFPHAVKCLFFFPLRLLMLLANTPHNTLTSKST